MSRRGFSRKVMLLLLSTIVGLCLAELVIRWLDLVPPFFPQAPTAINLYHEDPNGAVRLNPGWEGYVSEVWTKVNGRGFRDRLFAAEPEPGVKRIAVFGDSYTMGDGVALESSFPKQLETLLREADVACEVMNCAVSATNSRNQLPIVREVIEEYHPDLAVLGYNLNDFDNPTQTRFQGLEASGRSMTVGDDGRVTIHDDVRSWHQRVRFAIYKRSHLYRYLMRFKEKRGASPGAPVKAVEAWIDAGDHLLSFDAVAGMKEACEAQGIPFLVVVLPDQLRQPRSVRDYSDYTFADVHELILEELGARGVECFDFAPTLAGRDPHELEVHRTDPHFNHEGNRLVAEFIKRIVEERL